MSAKANCKINIGLNIIRKRQDGFHDIDTLMVPVKGLYDTIDLTPSDQSSLTVTGIPVDCPPESNLCMKALRLMQANYGAGEARIEMRKQVPHGAGLGGGSSDAATVIKRTNEVFGLGLDNMEMERAAAAIGSDIPFFIENRIAMASGRGEIITPAQESIAAKLSGKHLLIIKPDIQINTGLAYSSISPKDPEISLSQLLDEDICKWKELIENRFEAYVFSTFPHMGVLKWALYNMGALYASLSGSGSALYGIFNREPRTDFLPGDLFVHQQILDFN